MALGSQFMAFGGVPIVRLVDHFACTGGTVICRAIGALPNTYLLSEIEPHSAHPMMTSSPKFAPSDIIQKLRHQLRPIDPTVIAEVYLSSVQSLVESLSRTGGHLVIRGHAHSLYCLEEKQSLPGNSELLKKRFQVSQIITVRNPVHSYVSLQLNSWEDFRPSGVGEYAKRYHQFLDDRSDAAMFKYEDFIDTPMPVLESICDALRLPFNAGAPYLLRDVRLTGASGRTGARLTPRPARPVPRKVAIRMKRSKYFSSLMERLGYDLNSSTSN